MVNFSLNAGRLHYLYYNENVSVIVSDFDRLSFCLRLKTKIESFVKYRNEVNALVQTEQALTRTNESHFAA